jgi:hypothetical protein
MYSTRYPAYFFLSWSDETGDHEEMVRLNKNTAKTDLYIELHPHRSLASRPIEPPPDNLNMWALMPVYLLYCVVVSLLIGVPVAGAVVIAYVLFTFIRAGLIATVQVLHGDRSLFQFTIREIALLTTVAALACGWYVHFLAMRH